MPDMTVTLTWARTSHVLILFSAETMTGALVEAYPTAYASLDGFMVHSGEIALAPIDTDYGRHLNTYNFFDWAVPAGTPSLKSGGEAMAIECMYSIER